MKLILSIAALVFTPNCLMPSMTVAAAVAEKLAVSLRGHEDNHARSLQEDKVDADFQKEVCIVTQAIDITDDITESHFGVINFLSLPDAAGDVLIEADIEGDFGQDDELATFINEDLIPFLTLGGTGFDCIRDSGNSGNVTVTAAVFNGWQPSANVAFIVVLSDDVDNFCTRNSLGITLTYESKPGDVCPSSPTASPTVTPSPTFDD